MAIRFLDDAAAPSLAPMPDAAPTMPAAQPRVRFIDAAPSPAAAVAPMADAHAAAARPAFADDLDEVYRTYPRLKGPEWQIVDSRADGVQDGRKLEFYPPDERDNPNPGKPTLQLFDPTLQGQTLRSAIAGDMLHHLPSADQDYARMRDQFAGTMTPHQLAIDERVYRESGDPRSFDDWFKQSRLDAYIRGYITPDDADEWRKQGIYTQQQQRLLGSMDRHLRSSPTPAPTGLPRPTDMMPDMGEMLSTGRPELAAGGGEFTSNGALETAPGAKMTRLQSGASSFIQGAGDVVAGIPKAAAISRASGAADLLAAYDSIDNGGNVTMGQFPAGSYWDVRRYAGATPEARATMRAAIAPEDLDPRTSPAYHAGQAIQVAVRDALPADPAYAEDFGTTQVPQALGSTAAFLATGVAGRAAGVGPALSSAGAGGASMASDQFEDALNHGASIETAIQAAGQAVPAGMSEALPIGRLLDRLDKGTGGNMRRLLVETLKQGTEEAIQEFSQQVWQNAIAQNLYDPTRNLLTDAPENAGVGFTVGALMEFVLGLAMGKRGHMAPGGPQQPPAAPGAAPERQEPYLGAAPPVDAQGMPPVPIIIDGRPSGEMVFEQPAGLPDGALPAEAVVGATPELDTSWSPDGGQMATTPPSPPRRSRDAFTADLSDARTAQEREADAQAEQDTLRSQVEEAGAATAARLGYPAPGSTVIYTDPEGNDRTGTVSAYGVVQGNGDVNGDRVRILDTESGAEAWPMVDKAKPRLSPGIGTQDDPVRLESPEHVSHGAEITATPTPAQAEAGNYAKRHVKWNGLDISIETETGQQRTGIGPDGKPWSVTMPAPYGYIRRTEGSDGDHVDLYMGPDPQSKTVYVIDQIDPATGKFDEHKVMLGFDHGMNTIDLSKPPAWVQTYLDAFSDGSGAHRIGSFKAMSVDEFKTWLAKGDTTKALSYKAPVRALEPRVETPPAAEGVGQPAVATATEARTTHASADRRMLARAIKRAKLPRNPKIVRSGDFWQVTVPRAHAVAMTDAVARETELTAGRRTSAQKARQTRIGNTPLDIVSFIASIGGIKADESGDVRAMIGKPNQMVRDFGPLIRTNGLSLDVLRAAATEAGYFGDRLKNSYGGTGEVTTVDSLLAALGDNLRGRRVFASGDEALVAENAETAAQAEQQARSKDLPQEIQEVSDDNGYGLSSAEVAAAAELVRGGMTVDEAVVEIMERGAIEAYSDAIKEIGDAETDGTNRSGEEAAQGSGGDIFDLAGEQDGAAETRQPTGQDRQPQAEQKVRDEEVDAVDLTPRDLPADPKKSLEPGVYTIDGVKVRVSDQAVHAVEPGYFPYSHSGFHSTMGEDLTAAGLGKLAADQSKWVSGWIKRLDSAMKAKPNFGDFITLSGMHQWLQQNHYDGGPPKAADIERLSPDNRAAMIGSIEAGLTKYETADWDSFAKDMGRAWTPANAKETLEELRSLLNAVQPTTAEKSDLPPSVKSAEPKTEKTAQGEQAVIPGAEQSARQAQASRDQTGTGRIRATKPQKNADEGLFDTERGRQKPMFAKRDAVPTDTAAFKAWFGDSQMVGADGQPRAFYHGTASDFEAFTPERGGALGRHLGGIYFSPDPGLSDMYANFRSKAEHGRRVGDPSIMPVYLRITNPLVIEEAGFWEKMKAKLTPDGPRRLRSASHSGMLSHDDIAKYKKQGYDGIVNKRASEVVVFDPAQIKSVFNRGTFDAEDQRISYAKRKAVQVPADSVGAAGMPIRQLRQRAYTWFREHLVGKSVVNEATGKTIAFDGTGAKKTVWGRGEDLTRLVPALSDLLRRAELIETVADRNGDTNVKAWHSFRADVRLGDKDFGVVMKVREMADGNYHYSLHKENVGGPSETEAGQPAKAVRVAALEGAPDVELNISAAPVASKPAETASVFNALRAELDRMNLNRIGVKLPEQIDGGDADGMYMRRVISVALDTKNKFGTLHHETIHAMKRLGMFQGSEWRALEQVARDKWLSQYKIAERYSELSEAEQIEEAVAHAFADYMDGTYQPKGLIGRAFAYLKRLLESVKSALGEQGFKSWEDVFEAAADGHVGARDKPGRTRTMEPQLSPAFAAAWHGTPHEVEQFSTEKIGTGEGAQAFGWGLYFAGKKSVAEHYRDALAARRQLYWDGEPISEDDLVDRLRKVGGGPTDAARFVDSLVKGLTSDSHMPSVGTIISAGAARGADRAELEKIGRTVSEHVSGKPRAGRLYKVNLAPAEEDYLLWDKPLSKQSEKVKKALAPLGFDGSDYNNWIGQDIYHQTQLFFDNPKEASEALAEAGIPGIKYLDHGSRNKPLRDIKRQFLEMLPEDADTEEVVDMLGTGQFTAEQETFLRALQADDWFGFDYPAQGISAALSDNPQSWEASEALLDSIDALRGDATFNYVIFDDSNVKIEAAYAKRETEQTDQGDNFTLGFDKETPEQVAARKRQEDKAAAEAAMNGKKKGKAGQQVADDLPLFGGDRQKPMFAKREKDTDGVPKLVREPETAAERKEVMLRSLFGKMPVDRALRIPFAIFGGVDRHGEWKPGAKLWDKAANVITGAKFTPHGRFAFINPVLDIARRNLVDRYDLTPEYVTRDRARALDERRIQKKGLEFINALKDSGMGPDEAKVLQGVLTGEAVAEGDWNKLAVPIRQAIDELGAEAVELGLVSKESYERNRGTYLHRVYLKNEGDLPALARWSAQMMGKKRKQIVGDELKGRGIFLDIEMPRLLAHDPEFKDGAAGRAVDGQKFVVLDRHDADDMLDENKRPKVIERVFWPADRAVPAKYQGKAWTENGTWQVRGVKGNKVTIWRDYSKEERERMGEILDARYTIGKTFMLMSHDLATGRFYKDVAMNSQWSRSDQPNTRWVDAADYNRYWASPDIDWVKVPETEVPNSGGKKRFGALAGQYVRAEIWRDMNEVDQMSRPNLWTKMLTQWKLNKTARSPVVHMNNVMSNLMFLDMADVPVSDLVRGIKAYATSNKDYQEAADAGAFGSDMMSVEIRKNVLEPVLKELRGEALDGRTSAEAKMGVLGKLAEGLWGGLKTADEAMIDAYRMEDEVFRMAVYMRRRSQGDTPTQAADHAREQFLDYDIRAPLINLARRTFLPFIGYIYRAVPVVARSIAARPWKLGKYFLIAYMANALSYAIDDDDDEDYERRSLRDNEQGNTWLGVPRMIRTPFRDHNGNPVFLDVRRWIPAGDVFDLGQGSSALPIPAPLMFGGPLMLAAELFLNRSGFTGQDITNKLIDSPWDRASKVGDYLWKSWMPGAAWVPNSWYWNKIENSIKGVEGSPSVANAALSSVGVKVGGQDIEQNMSWRAHEFKKVERELKFEAGRIARQHQRGMISETEFNRAMNDLIEKSDRLTEKAGERLKPPATKSESPKQ